MIKVFIYLYLQNSSDEAVRPTLKLFMIRSILPIVFILSLCSCGAKEKWTKDVVVNKCLADFNKRNEEEKVYSTMQIALLCDCVATKLTTNYKSGSEADKDDAGSTKIGEDCANEVLKETK